MKSSTRAKYDALAAEERARVDAIFAPEIARGWIPVDADVEAAIALVLRPGGGSAGA